MSPSDLFGLRDLDLKQERAGEEIIRYLRVEISGTYATGEPEKRSSEFFNLGSHRQLRAISTRQENLNGL
jgi:hypothetical protein